MELKDFIKTSKIQITEMLDDELNEEQLQQVKTVKTLKDKIVTVLKTIYDPEISINILDLGLIYKINVFKKNRVAIDMTLTTPLCPVADAMPQTVELKLRKYIPEISNVDVKLVWEPQWNKNMISEEAKLLLDMW